MLKTEIRFGLRVKLLAIMFICIIILFIFLQFYILPKQDNLAKDRIKNWSQKHLQTLAVALVSPLLKRQYAALYELLDNQLNNNKNWKYLSLTTQDGLNIYPLGTEEFKPAIDEIVIEMDIVFLDEKLAHLALTASIKDELNSMHRQVYISSLIILVFLCLLLFFLLCQIERLIIEPVYSLNKAFIALTEQNYDYPLPKIKRDEIGLLIKGFRVMREKLKQDQEEQRKLYQTEKQLSQTIRLTMQELETAHQEAIHANRAKSEFLANMSHEIRTPLNAVTGMSYLLRQTPLNQKQLEYINTIHHSMVHVTNIINDLLDFSKIEAQRLELESVSFDLDKVMDTVADFVMLDAEQKGLELIFDIPINTPRSLVGDETRLGQILTNLVGNAVKFCQQGEIVVSISSRPLPLHKVILSFTVKDTGIGITQEELKQIFAAFKQADTSTTRKFGGTGLGLAICQHLVHAMDGEISVKSQVGIGSEFSFYVKLGLQPQEKYKSFTIPQDLNQLNVLLVDDNTTCRTVTGHILSELSFSHTDACSGEQAIEIIKQNNQDSQAKPFDLILMDWKMPGMDGLETTQFIKQSLALDYTPIVIILTAHDKNQILSLAHQVGVQDCLPKPINASQLYDCIMQALDKQVPKAHWRGQLESTDQYYKINGQGKRILLVEDQVTNRQIAKEILTHNGFHVEAVENGQQAVDLVRRDSTAYDAVLMDIQMPDIDGYEATRLIRKIVDKEHLPIIALTAHAIEEERRKCLLSGMNSHISKPIDVNQLLSELCRCLAINCIQESPSELQQTELPDSLPGINIKQGVQRLLGNTSLYCQLLSGFSGQQVKQIAEIRQAIDQKKFTEAEKLLHTLSGSAGNLSMPDLRRAAKLLQYNISINSVKQDDWEVFENAFQQVIHSINTLNLLHENESDEAKNTEINTLEQQRIHKMILQLINYLKDHDLRAEKLFREIKPCFSKDFYPEISDIADAIKQLDYDKAVLLLNSLMDKLDHLK